MALFQNNLLMGAASQSGSSGYSIDQSIRFNPSDSAYMSRTQDTAASKQKFTFSWWMKLGVVDDEMVVISGGASSRWLLRFNTAQQLTFRLTNGTTEKTMTTTMKFRDNSAWYHCVWTADCTNDISSDYSRFFVNGERVAMTGTQPSADTDFAGYGDATTAAIGCLAHSLGTGDFNGYLAEMVLIDNQALTPSSFGELSDDGIWRPKDVSGLTFSTNGFWVDGRDSGDLGDDESGNGNDWSTSGLATHDQFLDSPTNNFCTMNPLANRLITYKNGNMESNATSQTTAHKTVKSTLGIPPSATGKYYFEWQVPSSTASGDVDIIGFCDLEDGTNTESSTVNSGRGYGIGYKIGTGSVYAGTGWTANSFTFGGFVASNYYGFAYDASTGKLYIYQNGSALNSGAHVATFDKSSTIAPGYSQYNNTSTYNFFNGAQTSLTNSNFNYAPPTGYVPINTANIGDEF